MRKTKFRGKSERNGQWYEGDFISDTREFNRTCDKAYILPYWEKLNSPIAVIPETVGQFTGLNDSTTWEDLSKEEQSDWLNKGKTAEEWCGKAIYEGAIVHVWEEDYHSPNYDSGGGIIDYSRESGFSQYGVVDFKTAWFTYETKVHHKGRQEDILAPLDFIENIKVIGNIHDHIQLLEKQLETE